MTCDVCDGTGYYPVINRRGRTVYEIRCPECLGASDSQPSDAHHENSSATPRDRPDEEHG